MNTSRIWIVVAASSIVGWVAVLGVGIANADCTGAGDFGAASGCAPPGSSGSGNTESWPPTAVDWPPQLGADSDKDNGGKGGGDAKSTPIVMPRPEASAGGLGADSSESEHERNTDPDRDCAQLELSACAETTPHRYLAHGRGERQRVGTDRFGAAHPGGP